jgi:MYXO-CTERM domain-containing protein
MSKVQFQAKPMRRAFLAVAISAAAVLSSVGVAAPASAGELDDGTGWFLQVTSNTTALIDGYDYDNPGNYVNDIFGSDLVIPSTVGNYTITGITDYAFADRGLTSVVFPASLTSIGTAAFVRNNFTSVTIPAGVTSINDATFAHNALTSVALPASLTSIEKNAFYDNALTSVTIPDGVTKIDADAFYFNRLASVTIPDSVTTIGDEAFGWNQLTSVTLGQSVSFIGDTAFTSNLLTSVHFPASLTHLGYFSFGGNSLTSATFDGNAPVGNNVFGNNQNLHELRREICTQWAETFSGLPVKLVKKPRCTLPGVPVIKGVVMGNGVVKVGLAAQQDNGKDRIRGYEYTTDNGASGSTTNNGFGFADNFSVSSVPTPSAAALVGLAGLLARRRRA